VRATERDVRLVVVNGRPLYGTTELMRRARATARRVLRVGGESRALALTRFLSSGEAWSFASVLQRLREVRADPKLEIDAARARAYGSAERGEPPPLRLALDMPTGRVPIGGLPKDLGQIVVPEIQPIAHDAAFFAQVAGRGFHGGLLDRLSAFYA
jgi:hypothetical protein